MRKILVLSFYFPPDLSAGSFRTGALIQAFNERNSDEVSIDVITTLPNRYSSFDSSAAQYEATSWGSVTRVRLPKHKSGMRDQSVAFLAYARAVREIVSERHYDLVYATSSRLMTAVLGAWVAKKMDTLLYLDLRDIFVDTIKDVMPKWLATVAVPPLSLLERWAINSAAGVNLVSRGFQSYFEGKYQRRDYSYFTNGIDPEFLERPSESDKLKTSADPRVTVLYAGNVGEGQGLHNILPDLAMRMASRVRFIVIGDGGRMDALRRALIEKSVSNVELLPPVGREALISAYRAADVLFVHLNDYEAFLKVLPSKFFEYGAMGKPIWAGVAGYSAAFVHSELDNAVTFRPCDVDEAISVFDSLKIETKSRFAFLDKFSRQNIMRKMVGEVMALMNRRQS